MPSILTAVRDLDRAREIAVVLARHGFGEVAGRMGFRVAAPADAESGERATLARRLRVVLQELGPSFVKLGQIASTRADLLPADVVAELRKLQDAVPPFPTADARATIEAQLGAPIEELFSRFDDTPLASASIAQVHRARLKSEDGEHEVVLKVQRPNIASTIQKDVDLLYWFAHALERAVPESKVYGPADLVAEFDRSITAELDFVQEAENAERFADNFGDHPAITFPMVYKRASGKRVLCLEFLAGRKIDQALREGVDGKRVAESAVDVVIRMIFEHGFFHADPHPGNILILGPVEAPVIGLLDLGLVGHLSPAMRDRAIDLMVAAAREDIEGIADSLYRMGRPARKVDMAAYRADVAMLSRKYLGKSIKEIEISGLIRDLVYGAVKHGIDMPPDFLMVGKALMTLEGIGRQLDPDLDIFTVTKPHFLRLLGMRYAPDKLTNDAMRAMVRFSGLAGQMPEQVSEILDDLRKGHLLVKATDPVLPTIVDRLGRKVYDGLVVSSLIVAGGLVLASGRMLWLGLALLGLAALGGAWHTFRSWWTDNRIR